MKKSSKIIYLLLFVLGFTILSCRDDDDDNPYNPNDAGVPKISFVTNLADDDVRFYITTKDDIEVDFGDGKKIKQTKSPTDGEIYVKSKLLGKEVKIYAPNANSISELSIYNQKLTSVDVRNAVELEELDLASNELSSLDVSKNTKLDYLDFSENKIKQSASNAILNALPKRTNDDKGEVWVFYNKDGREQNEMPNQQAIDAAMAKFWSVNHQGGDEKSTSTSPKKSLERK